MTEYTICLSAALLSLIICAVTLKILIPKLRELKIGQHILKLGPSWHAEKEGTPTMGGIAFALSITVVFIIFLSLILALDINGMIFGMPFSQKGIYGALFSLLYSLLCGACGAVDDVCKLVKKQNAGLSAKQKYLILLAITILYLFAMHRFCDLGTTLFIQFFNVELEMGIGFWVFSTVLLTGMVNAVNLTDGIDGLCGSVSAVVLLYFLACALYIGSAELSVLSCAAFGGVCGFLIFNLHPARIFMGDTGSLFLGALISSLAFAVGSPMILFAVGIVFMWEAFSVIIQVIFFKMTKKRVFKMAPFHHHLEKNGWSEGAVVCLFTSITAACVVLCMIFA